MSLLITKPVTGMWIMVVFGAIGIPAVVYGMMAQNHVVFIIGLILVVMAYLLIRRRLKPSVRGNG